MSRFNLDIGDKGIGGIAGGGVLLRKFINNQK